MLYKFKIVALLDQTYLRIEQILLCPGYQFESGLDKVKRLFQ